MIENISNTYSGVRVSLDNQSYEKCIFTNCTIEYAGTGPISLSGCSFNNCQWLFTGDAQNTLNFMQVMYHQMGGFGKSMIEATFENIKQGVAPITSSVENH
ncbi:MAG: hypothetical protein PSN04_01560 [Methyloprofundus sp.]|nr:hypothetical protein [Methyloprofundus sp.]